MFKLEYGNSSKFSLYISETKVKTLFSQIPSTLKTGAQTGAQGLLGELACVCQFLIETEQVGSETSDCTYIGGTLPLRYGAVSEYASAISFFGEIIEGTKVGLVGTISNLVRKVKLTEANHAPFYYTLEFLNHIIEVGEETNQQPDYESYEFAFDTALNSVPKKQQKFEFVAKVLYREQNLVIATPLYVALAAQGSFE